MKNKKGFTLVELLAVIAILAVILLLIVPNIVDMFNNGKKDAFIRQVQSVWREAEKEYTADLATENKTQVYSDKVSNVGRELKLNKTDITYVAGFDEHGVINYIAVGNMNYCYVKNNPSTMEIKREDLIEGKLSCTSQGCTCGSLESSFDSSNSETENMYNGYVYWDSYTAGNFVSSYEASSEYQDYNYYDYPSNAVSDYNDLISNTFIRTTLQNGNVVLHEVCVKGSGNYFCVPQSYFTASSETSLYTLQHNLALVSNLPDSSVWCNTANDESYCYTNYGYYECGFGRGYDSTSSVNAFYCLEHFSNWDYKFYCNINLSNNTVSCRAEDY